jgi:hypothetical protein
MWKLYEALIGSGLREDAARLIAEIVPPSKDLALRSDVLAIDAKIDNLEVKLQATESRLEAKMQALHASSLRWMLGLFVPVWAATWGTLLVALLRT